MPEDVVGEPVLTAAEFDELSPAARREAFDTRVVTDLDQLPSAYRRRLQQRAQSVIARRDAERGPQPGVPHAS